MLLSRTKPDIAASSSHGTSDSIGSSVGDGKVPSQEEFLSRRDFNGALALLEFQRNAGKNSLETDLWIAYCAFHLGNYKQAAEEYNKVLKRKNTSKECWTYLACCQFYMGLYQEAENSAAKGAAGDLQNRLLFHLAHKAGDEAKLMSHHQQLQDILADQLSLASVHYLRSHYQEAIDVYKRILLDNREFLALNVYVALCYYKLDYYDVSQEVLAVYLQHFPDSATAINLKACNHFRLYNGKAAEAELAHLAELASPSFAYAKDLTRHNTVVFRGGEGALQVLPPLVDILPEARLNLVIYHLKQDDIESAHALIKELEPSVPHEYILKAVVNAAVGQEQGAYLLQREHLKVAQQYFQLVGGSATECDTIPGRQCMASCFFLLKQFDDVLLYLNSIKSYFYNDDTFNFNYAQAKAATGAYAEAEDLFLLIQSDKIKQDYVYQSWLVRCLIMNRKPQRAWELYERLQDSAESFSLLQLIANDCYRMGQFITSLRAFEQLDTIDPNPEYWEGKQGATLGILQKVIAGQEPKESLSFVWQLLKKSNNPHAEPIIRAVQTWAKENRMPL
ncbi:intraflagellar transport protein 56-like [Varroa jacobsoni]|uniref:Intraflagellar transport protein 56 n=1 Tax=Varroa destructor TaxID=109461 RepID=A0A7M7J7S7_VARDE|nr:intraflagellar transport protein 56-like [Varroa destructor]XP_022708401.1 intraflagellar transport protein 56-like [Varroa jacobsoni]